MGATPQTRMARIAHHVPGRMRLKVVGAPAEHEFFSIVKKVISSLQGVETVRVNPSSASIVIDYAPTDTVFHFRLQEGLSNTEWLRLEGGDALLARVDEAVAEGSHYLAPHSRLAQSIVTNVDKLDTGLLHATDGYVDLKLLLPLVFAAATSMRQARGRGTPMWLSLGTFAFNSFLTLHRERTSVPTIKVMSTGKAHAPRTR